MSLTICDKCNNEINIDIKQLIYKDITVNYLECENCNEKYYITFVNNEMERLIKANNNYLKVAQNANIEFAKNMINKINKNKIKIEEINERNKKEFLNQNGG